MPWDGGTTNRPGPRHAPRQLRDHSSMVRRMQRTRAGATMTARNGRTSATVWSTRRASRTRGNGSRPSSRIVAKGIRPLSAGGDHLCRCPSYAPWQKKPVGMIHFDTHTDFYDSYFGGFRYTHGTPFRRATEEGLLDPRRVIQIGLRGSV